MNAWVSLDGAIVPAAEARISVFDRGFLYGDSVFEVLRTYRGVPFALREHLERLSRSADRALIPLPISVQAFEREVGELLSVAKFPETYLRIVLSRGTGTELGLSPGLGTKPLRVVMALELPAQRAAMYERGISVITFQTQRVADSTPASGAKVSNYLIAVLATRAAEQSGAEESLVLDRAGRVAEGSTSNVFFVKDGVLVTPPEEAGILLGITRDKLLGLAAEWGVPVELRSFLPAELLGADEAFITSSIREVAPVVRVDGQTIGSGKPGALTLRFLQGFRALANAGAKS
ncbi:MAG TPA: aminotransferase class IV [Polyangiaceae bacterium]